MSYFAHIVDVPAPVAVYDATHAELLRRTGGHVDGLVVHICRATESGFQVVEVWTDRPPSRRPNASTSDRSWPSRPRPPAGRSHHRAARSSRYGGWSSPQAAS